MTREEKAAVKKALMTIWGEVSDLPIDEFKFTAGLRGNLKITISNAMQTLGLGPPWATHYVRKKRKRCGAKNTGSVCNKAKGHSGVHRQSAGNCIASWPRVN